MKSDPRNEHGPFAPGEPLSGKFGLVLPYAVGLVVLVFFLVAKVL